MEPCKHYFPSVFTVIPVYLLSVLDMNFIIIIIIIIVVVVVAVIVIVAVFVNVVTKCKLLKHQMDCIYAPKRIMLLQGAKFQQNYTGRWIWVIYCHCITRTHKTLKLWQSYNVVWTITPLRTKNRLFNQLTSDWGRQLKSFERKFILLLAIKWRGCSRRNRLVWHIRFFSELQWAPTQHSQLIPHLQTSSSLSSLSPIYFSQWAYSCLDSINSWNTGY